MATGSHYAASVLSLKILRINKKEIQKDVRQRRRGVAFIVNSVGIIISGWACEKYLCIAEHGRAALRPIINICGKRPKSVA